MSLDSEQIFRRRIEELSCTAASQNRFTFTDFLTPAEQSYILSNQKILAVPAAFSGGYEHAERVMARFGSSSEFGYETPFPIVILQIRPLNEKFSDTLTHRDFLGALMNMGIERRLIGDILTNGTQAWFFTQEKIASFIIDSLIRVKHTCVSVSQVGLLPEDVSPQPEILSLVVPSLRLDAVIAKLYHLSRKDVQNLLSAERIFINSRIQTKASHLLTADDLISVRGYGRFRFLGVSGDTRKGNLRITAEKF